MVGRTPLRPDRAAVSTVWGEKHPEICSKMLRNSAPVGELATKLELGANA